MYIPSNLFTRQNPHTIRGKAPHLTSLDDPSVCAWGLEMNSAIRFRAHEGRGKGLAVVFHKLIET